MSAAPMDDERVAADGIAGHRRRARGLPGLAVVAPGQSGCVLPLSRRGSLRSGRASLRRRAVHREWRNGSRWWEGFGLGRD